VIGIEILTIGTEIVGGTIPDTNFLFLARGLAARGLRCRWHTAVPDDRETLAAALQTALGRATVIVTSGGLGPTPDDITRKVVATVLKRQLVLREDVVQLLQDRFARTGRAAPPNIQAQALVPFGCDLIENELGSAPGLRLQTEEGRILYALPGVPHELERMAERIVLPEISSLIAGTRIAERNLRTVGVPESVLSERLAGLAPPGGAIAFLPHLGHVDVRLSVEGQTHANDAILDRLTAEATERIGDAVYGKGSEELEEVVGGALMERGWHIAVAESLTGGALGARIVRVPGASRYYLGDVVAYDNGAKTSILGVPEAWIRDHGAVSGPVAEAMAHGVRERFAADVGVSTTGIAGPDGGSEDKPVGLVYFGICWPGGRISVRRQLLGERSQVIARSVTTALDLVRRVAGGLTVT
jgi:nicotinamide-nucleotide amidase